jgi:hypothetical protein
LQEGVRRHDVVAAETRSHDRWLISDTSVAAIRTAPLAPGLDRTLDGYAPLRWILAKTPGRATLSAFDIVPYSGSPATNEPPTRINHEVVVIPRLQSLRIAAIRDTVGYGEPVRVRVETRDMNDRVVRGVPVAVRSPIAIVTVTDSGGAYVSAPGSHVLVAQFWQLRDSVRVVIRPPARR